MILCKSSVTLCGLFVRQNNLKSTPRIFRIFFPIYLNSIYLWVYFLPGYRLFLLDFVRSILYNVTRPLLLSGRAGEIKKKSMYMHIPQRLCKCWDLQCTFHMPLFSNTKFWRKVPRIVLLSLFPNMKRMWEMVAFKRAVWKVYV